VNTGHSCFSFYFHDDTCTYLVYECILVCPVCALIPVCTIASCVDENWYIICKQSTKLWSSPENAKSSVYTWEAHNVSCMFNEIIQFFVMNYIHDHSVYTTLFLVCCELSKNTGSMEIIQVFFVNAMRSYRFNSCFIRSRSWMVETIQFSQASTKTIQKLQTSIQIRTIQNFQSCLYRNFHEKITHQRILDWTIHDWNWTCITWTEHQFVKTWSYITIQIF
jgi:hypothetical protein